MIVLVLYQLQYVIDRSHSLGLTHEMFRIFFLQSPVLKIDFLKKEITVGVY